jgi:hypothetical protein
MRSERGRPATLRVSGSPAGTVVVGRRLRGCATPERKEPVMANKIVVLGIFKDEAAADAAALTLKDSGLASGDAIGVLVLDERGEVDVEKVGKRSMGKGAGIGLALALFTPVGLGVGVIGGGLLGALHHKGLGLDREDRDRIGEELAGGKAAVGVLAPVAEADAVTAKITDLGGAAESHAVTDEALEEAHAAATADAS